jgi:hypothetical protein
MDEQPTMTLKSRQGGDESEDVPFGAHIDNRTKKTSATIGDLDDDLGHGIFATYLGFAATLAGVAVVGLFVQARLRTEKMKVVSDLCAATALLVVVWAIFVFFGFRKRHWTAWIMCGILLVFVSGLLVLLCM